METKRTKSFQQRLDSAFGSLVLSIIVEYNVFLHIAPTLNMEFQIKVEYVKEKWITFMVSSSLASAAECRFKDLVDNITSCCTTLLFE